MCPFMRQINIFDDMIRQQQTQFVAINIDINAETLNYGSNSNRV